MDVAIVGAGIGGLTAALALQAAGLEARVYESAHAASEHGAGIQLGPNATRLLARVGVLDGVRVAATMPAAITLCDALRGGPVARLPLGERAEQRYGAPYLHVHRLDLHAALLAAACANGIPIALDAHVESLQEHPEHVQLSLRDGGSATAALCIGADGIHSTVRRHVVGNDDARFAGQLAYRALVPTTAVALQWRTPGATVWMAPGAHLVHYPVRAGEQINLVAVVEQTAWREERWDSPADPSELQAHFAHCHAAPRALLQAVTACHRWALFDRPPRRPWVSARCALLGDACHATLPFLAQGAAMAIEDAFVLAATLVARAKDHSPAQALADYERTRFPRTSRVHAAGVSQGHRFHRRSSSARSARNFVLGLGSRFAPTMALRSYDWLYGHDAAPVSSPRHAR